MKGNLLRYTKPDKSSFTLSKLRFIRLRKPYILSFYSFILLQGNKNQQYTK